MQKLSVKFITKERFWLVIKVHENNLIAHSSYVPSLLRKFDISKIADGRFFGCLHLNGQQSEVITHNFPAVISRIDVFSPSLVLTFRLFCGATKLYT